MKKIINQTIHKVGLHSNFLAVFTFVAFIICSLIFFYSYKNDLEEKTFNKYRLNIDYLNVKINNKISHSNKNILIDEIKNSMKSDIFESVSIKMKRFIFDKNILIDNSKDFDDKSWNIAEVVVDARYGYINKIPKSSLFEFISSDEFDPSQEISIRYQVYKKSLIKNILTKLKFSDIEIIDEENKYEKDWMDLFVDIGIENRVYDIKIDGIIVGSIHYKLNNNLLNNELKIFLIKLLFFNFLLFSPTLFVLGFYHKYLYKNYVIDPIVNINDYLENILKENYVAFNDKELTKTKEIKELSKKATKISVKLASLRNEINENKDSLEEKATTDALTGLPNKSIFDSDIKTMFVSSIPGFIFIIKLDELAKISKEHDSGYINNYIESFTNTIKNIIFKYSKTDMKLFRFYGSQFAIIAKNIDNQTATKMCEEIIDELTDILPTIYDIPEDIIQIGGTPFDLYGSLDTILDSANNAYSVAKQKGPNSFHITKETDISVNYTLIDNSVIEVINNENFTLDYIMDSYLFDDPNKVVMKEVSPQIYDHNNEKIAIGSFVAIAQKLKLAEKFDKQVILKVIEDIKNAAFSYEVAVNLSINSLDNKDFRIWLTSLLKENKDITKSIVFSVTAYTANLKKDIFIDFAKDIHSSGGKILIKRYKTDEYPLEELDFVDYIRMNKDYTANFVNDMVKKHKVKNILIFGELNDIRIIADSVKLDADYELLDRFGAYATSR